MSFSRPKPIDDSQSGQSTLEFALSLILLLAFTLFFIQSAMVLAFGSYAHYATFMAARAYLSGGPTLQDQKARATTVALRMLKRSETAEGVDKFPTIAKGVGGGDIKGLEIDPPSYYQKYGVDFSWAEGVRYTFKSRIVLIPLAGALDQTGKNSTLNSLQLKSESFLGREPTVEECTQVLSAKQGYFDNGC